MPLHTHDYLQCFLVSLTILLVSWCSADRARAKDTMQMLQQSVENGKTKFSFLSQIEGPGGGAARAPLSWGPGPPAEGRGEGERLGGDINWSGDIKILGKTPTY